MFLETKAKGWLWGKKNSHVPHSLFQRARRYLCPALGRPLVQLRVETDKVQAPRTLALERQRQTVTGTRQLQTPARAF